MKPILVFIIAALTATAFACQPFISPGPSPARFTVSYVTATYAVPGQGNVSVDIAKVDDGTTADQARERVRGHLPFGTTKISNTAPAPFVLNGLHRPNPTTVYYNPSGAPIDGQASVVNGMAHWNGISPNFGYAFGGTTASSSNMCTGAGDGVNEEGWAEESGSILGVSCWNGNGECDIVYDPGWPWTTSTTSPNVDLESVTTHENGHCLGLNHSTDPAAVMYPSYNQGSIKRTPNQDDVAGLCAIYGCGSPSTPTPVPPTPTRPPTATPTAPPFPTPTLPPRLHIPGITRG